MYAFFDRQCNIDDDDTIALGVTIITSKSFRRFDSVNVAHTEEIWGSLMGLFIEAGNLHVPRKYRVQTRLVP